MNSKPARCLDFVHFQGQYNILAQVLILVSLAVLGLSSRADASTSSPKEPLRIAILVGANGEARGGGALKYAHTDAQSLSTVLAEIGGFRPQNIHCMIEPKPQQVLSLLDAQLEVLKAYSGETLLLFYYSGHADQNALYPGGSPLLLSDLKRRLDAPKASVRVGIIDGCRGGSWTRAKGLTPRPPFEVNVPFALDSEGSVLIASSSGDESAHEAEALRGSFFTHHLVAGLRGAADRNHDSIISIGEAFEYAREFTVRDTTIYAPMPQHPSFNIHLRGRQDVSLARLDKMTALVVVQQTRGPIEIIQLSSGVVVAELQPGEREVRMALPPGRYLMRRRAGTDVFVKELNVKHGESLRVEEASLVLVGQDALARKAADGVEGARAEADARRQTEIEALGSLVAQQRALRGLVQALKRSVPGDLQLKELELKGLELTLRGESPNNEEVGALIDALESSDAFSKVYLCYTKVSGMLRKTREFELVARYEPGSAARALSASAMAPLEAATPPGTEAEEYMLLELRKGLAKEGQLGEVLGGLASTFKAAGLRASLFRPLSVDTEEAWSNAPVEIALSGSISALDSFLNSISAVEHIITLNPIKVVAKHGDLLSENAIDISFHANLFFVPDREE